MKPVWPNKDAQKMPSMAARLPRPAADGLYLAIPIPYPHFSAYKISNAFSISLCKPQVNYSQVKYFKISTTCSGVSHTA